MRKKCLLNTNFSFKIKLIQFYLNILSLQSFLLFIFMSINEGSKAADNEEFNVGPWNQQESAKYLIFLDQNKIVMASKQKKKKYRVFDQMSDFVQTRNSLQCRSHHQKAIEKFKDVKEIILYEKQQLGAINYRMQFKELRQKAKVKHNYENPHKTRKLQQNISQLEGKKVQKQISIPMHQAPTMPNFFTMLPGQVYSMFPFNPSQMYGNYFFYSNFNGN